MGITGQWCQSAGSSKRAAGSGVVVGMGVGKGSRVPVGGRVCVEEGVSEGVSEGSATVFEAGSRVRLAVWEGRAMSMGRSVGVAVGSVKNNGWQATRNTTRTNTSLGGVRWCMGQV